MPTAYAVLGGDFSSTWLDVRHLDRLEQPHSQNQEHPNSHLKITGSIKIYIMFPSASFDDGQEDQVPQWRECLINSLSWQTGAGLVPPYVPVLTAQREPIHAAQFLFNQDGMIHFVSRLLGQ